MAQQQHCQVERCYVCGVPGWYQLLLSCSKCSNIAIHKYCLGIVPGSVEEKKGEWVCDDCREPIITIQEQPEPMCTIFADQEPPEIMMGVVLIVSPCGQAIIVDDDPITRVDNEALASTAEKVVSDDVDGYKPCLAKAKINKRKNELEKLDVVGFRRSRRLKRRKILKKGRGVSVY